MNKFIPILTNQRVGPYKLGTEDQIQAKFQLFQDDKTKLSYIKNTPLELKLNYSGEFEIYVSGITNNYGIYTFYYPCSTISGVNSCLGYVTTTINDKIYDSNVVRFNFA